MLDPAVGSTDHYPMLKHGQAIILQRSTAVCGNIPEKESQGPPPNKPIICAQVGENVA